MSNENDNWYNEEVDSDSELISPRISNTNKEPKHGKSCCGKLRLRDKIALVMVVYCSLLFLPSPMPSLSRQLNPSNELYSDVILRQKLAQTATSQPTDSAPPSSNKAPTLSRKDIARAENRKPTLPLTYPELSKQTIVRDAHVPTFLLSAPSEQAYKQGIIKPVRHNGFNSLDVTLGSFNEKGEWQFDPITKKLLDLKWYNNSHSVCDVLNKYEITYIGGGTQAYVMGALDNAHFNNALEHRSARVEKEQAELVQSFPQFTESNDFIPRVSTQRDPYCRQSQLVVPFNTTSVRGVGIAARVARIRWNLPPKLLNLPNDVSPVFIVNLGKNYLVSQRLNLSSGGVTKYNAQGMYYPGRTMRKITRLMRKTLRRSQNEGVLIVFHGLTPVNPKADLFAGYHGKVNDVLGTLNARLLALSQAEGFCTLDLFRPLMTEVNLGWNIWEADGLTLSPSYHRLIAQWTLNGIQLCTKHIQPLETLFSWERQDVLIPNHL